MKKSSTILVLTGMQTVAFGQQFPPTDINHDIATGIKPPQVEDITSMRLRMERARQLQLENKQRELHPAAAKRSRRAAHAAFAGERNAGSESRASSDRGSVFNAGTL